MHIPFNKPFIVGRELEYIKQAVENEKISGDGAFTQKCSQFFQARYGIKRALLTTSCTDALEMSAILADVHPGDEIIMPSFTFVSTANAFVLRGAKIVFADCRDDYPNIDADTIEPLITRRTKAIVPVHYAGVACEMDKIMSLAAKYGLLVIEDAAQAVDSFYNGKALGSIGHMAAFSFHETKNIICGEGGMLAVNNEQLVERAEIIREKGTNRTQFFKGKTDKYTWVDIGSSFLPSDILAAFLYAQIEKLELIQEKRRKVWQLYYDSFAGLATGGKVKLPFIPKFATNNGHMFYLVCASPEERSQLIEHLKNQDIHAVFHYISLHKSPYYAAKHNGRELPNTDRYSDCLVRLPFFYTIKEEEQLRVIEAIHAFY